MPDSSDHAAWVRAAVERFEGPLIRHAAGITGDVERARDVVQDTFVRLCRADRGEVEGHLARWLFTVCRNRALDVLRKESRMKPTEDIAEHADGASAERGPIAALATAEAADHVWSRLSRLTDKQQQALLLKFQDGLSYREMAEAMDITVNHVGVLLHTALKALRKHVDRATLAPEA